jgi:hypothetical protein
MPLYRVQIRPHRQVPVAYWTVRPPIELSFRGSFDERNQGFSKWGWIPFGLPGLDRHIGRAAFSILGSGMHHASRYHPRTSHIGSWPLE